MTSELHALMLPLYLQVLIKELVAKHLVVLGDREASAWRDQVSYSDVDCPPGRLSIRSLSRPSGRINAAVAHNSDCDRKRRTL